MWAHYADCHQGVCFGFDASIRPFLSADKDKLLGLNKVSYTEFSTMNYLTDKEKALINMFSTKAPDWQYENEYRFLLSLKEGLYNFNKSILKEVIFGCKCSDESISEVINLCNQFGYEKLSYRKAKRVKLELKFDPIVEHD
ncbi:DUF2971 domain-containing protein [Chitinophaga rhizosphaerae]|uniref:DUF2971 domain-containing protein n=1 Tax=Chitinophaga rhizosphaerae TaxID=1864947 RepID=UPI000F80A3D5|nr:DUF2971 domain-containing protein [Chitinophaga rhizosphaerae]